MLATIVSEIPGRIRLRCGCGPLTASEVRGITCGLQEVEGVHRAQVHAANGSILLVFEPASRELVLSHVRSLDPLHLPRMEATSAQVPPEVALAEEQGRFRAELSHLTAFEVIRRLLLPRPLRVAWAILRAIPHLWEGLRHLLFGELTVEVLDAAAILTALLRRSFTEAGTIMFLLRLSAAMERHVESRVNLALGEGIIARAAEVWRVEDGRDVRIDIDEVRCGDVLHLGAGSVLPVDGTVVWGQGEVNEASMTGEAALVAKEVGSTVYAGTALEDGDLHVRVTAPPGRARIDAIVSMVQESSALKAGAQSRAERLADALVPYSFLAFFAILALTRNPATAATVLMVDYSCAIKLSTPVAVMSALKEATEIGAIVKGGKYLEALAAADTFVFDKTGTLTTAMPKVERVISFADMESEEILRYAACIEEHFPHSVARAVVSAARKGGLAHDWELHAQVNYVVAHGISTQVQGRSACIGSYHFVFEDEGVKEPEGMRERIEREAPATSVIYLAIDSVLEGAVCISDPARPESRRVIDALHGRGVRNIVMLTGDSRQVAESIAREVGVDDYRAQVLPDEKGAYIERMRSHGHVVCMVGDGINDSPALAASDVSVALSDASDIARAVADVTVLSDSLSSLVRMRDLADALMRRIHARYRAIVLINSALIALGVAGLISLTASAYIHNATTAAITAMNTRPLLRGKRTHR